jgi:hypothetical protein
MLGILFLALAVSQPASQPATCCCCCKWGCVISILGRLLGFVFVFCFLKTRETPNLAFHDAQEPRARLKKGYSKKVKESHSDASLLLPPLLA